MMRRGFVKKGWEVGEEREFNIFYRSAVVCGRCGHARDTHEFIDFGKEGRCEHTGCACPGFMSKESKEEAK